MRGLTTDRLNRLVHIGTIRVDRALDPRWWRRRSWRRRGSRPGSRGRRERQPEQTVAPARPGVACEDLVGSGSGIGFGAGSGFGIARYGAMRRRNLAISFLAILLGVHP